MKVLANIGSGITIEIEKDDGKEAIALAVELTNKWCHVCQKKKNSFRMLTNKTDDGFLYIKRLCEDCKAVSVLGSYKNGGYFWKKFEKYEGKKANKTIESAPLPPEPPEINEDDLPF